MKNNGYKYVIAFLIFYSLGLYFYCSHKLTSSQPVNIEKTDTIFQADTAYIDKTDTFYINKPIPTIVEKIRIDTVYDNSQTPIELITETKTFNNLICQDEDSVLLESSITGINAQLDYIKADWRKHNKVVTNTITVEKYIKPKKIRITPNAGFGYGLLNKQADFFIGIGVSINL